MHIGLKRRVKLQREDEENAGDGSGEALQEIIHCGNSLDLYFCYDQEASDEDVKDEENEGDGSGEALPARIIWLHWLDWWWWN